MAIRKQPSFIYIRSSMKCSENSIRWNINEHRFFILHRNGVATLPNTYTARIFKPDWCVKFLPNTKSRFTKWKIHYNSSGGFSRRKENSISMRHNEIVWNPAHSRNKWQATKCGWQYVCGWEGEKRWNFASQYSEHSNFECFISRHLSLCSIR